MADFRSLLEGLGCEDVRTYVQSGNAVVRTSLSPERLGQAVTRGFEHDLAVVVRTAAQMRRVVAKSPFSEPHVAFLARRPAAAKARELEGRDFRHDKAKVAGTEVYLHYSDGAGRTPLSNATIERILAVPATSRNWRTVTALATMASER
jgi:uncharacterized protein (DUF1697 family)